MAVEHKILRGAGAGKWLGFARAQLRLLAGQYVAQASRAKQKRRDAETGVRTRRLLVDGGMIEIKVSVNRDQHYIEIRRRSCPPFVSGLADLVLHTEEGIQPTPVYQVDDPNDPDPAATIDVFRRFYPSPAIPAEDRDWRDEPRLAKDQEAAKQMISLKASMFSGEMRKVVQILQGSNVLIPYSPVFGICHGVYKAANGQRWIVKISSQGVFAWPMAMCLNPVYNAAGELVLDYTPISSPEPTDIESATEAGTYVELLPSIGIRPFYNTSPFFFTCGWAFSEDGHKAANVSWTSQEVKRGHLHELTIAEVDGRLATASLVLVEEGVIHGPRASHMKYPQIGSNIYSFDPFYNDANYMHLCEAPVFCWYEGQTLRVVRYIYNPQTYDTVYSDSGTLFSNPLFKGNENRTLRSGTVTNGTDPAFQMDGWSMSGAVDSSPFYRESRYDLTPVGYIVEQAAGVATKVTDVFVVNFSRNDEAYGVRVAQVLIVPPYNREACYLVGERNREVTSGSQQAITGRGQDVSFSSTTQSTCSSLPKDVLIGDSFDPSPDFYEVTADNVDISNGATPGAVYQYADDGVPCMKIPTLRVATGSNVTVTLAASSRAQQAFTYFATGVTYGLPMPPGSAGFSGTLTGLFQYLNENETQAFIAEADGFDPGTFIISGDVGKVRGFECVSTAANYPVAEIGVDPNIVSGFSFVGVP